MPVIVVGNITVGGTGKSPMVSWLVSYLQQQGYRPGIVSRGYRSRLNKNATLLNDKHSAVDVGDEALMLYQNTGVAVAIGVNRVRAATLLIDQADCDIIISDDGLQHFALGRDLELVMIDAKRQFGNELCLPAGPLREPVDQLNDAAWWVYTEGNMQGYTMQLQPSHCYRLHDRSTEMQLETLAGLCIHAVAGIGNPQRFFATLRALGAEVIEHPLPDHHRLTEENLSFSDGNPVIITEKDAVKCVGFCVPDVWVLAIEAVPSESLEQALLHWLR